MDLLHSVILICGVNVWLTCVARGFFYPKYKKIGDMMSMTVVYGCFPLLVATVVYYALHIGGR